MFILKSYRLNSATYIGELYRALLGVLPWHGHDMASVRREYAVQGQGLTVDSTVSSLFDGLLQSGLVVDESSRKLTVEQFHNTLSMALAVGRLSGSPVRWSIVVSDLCPSTTGCMVPR